MAIDRVKVRAKITVGDLTVETPFIQSFTVNRRRGQSSTFDASMKVSHTEVSSSITGDNVKIFAGEDVAGELIFTGVVRQAKISPCYDDPKYVILSVSGTDTMGLLQGKKFTRRCRSTKTAWVSIQGVVRKGLKSGKFAYQSEPRWFHSSGETNKASQTTLYRPDSSPQTTKVSGPPRHANDVPPQLHVTPISPETGGVEGGANA